VIQTSLLGKMVRFTQQAVAPEERTGVIVCAYVPSGWAPVYTVQTSDGKLHRVCEAEMTVIC